MTQAPGTKTGPPSTSPLPATRPGGFIADPAPLGLAGFALTTFVLSVVNADIVPQELVGGALGLALAYGGIAQFAAGIWEFAKGNTFGATAFCSYGAFWISFWWLAEHDLANLGDEGYKVVGVYLLGWAIFTAYMTVAATRVSAAVLAVFALLTVTYVVLAIGWLDQESSNWIKIGGYLGIITALAAWYASFAGVTAFTFKRPVVPTGPRD
ncbi:MAG TPA: acetate uptake transporter [Nocardioides sp.]|uniref:acetate uptake transporter n=1 Tax=Nocardioides sp. TaxID=35761 RepID=UPI002E36D8FF|nr:acetate uptake transporter [Nocardioides sp.]HEX5086335.1 acetate uptake transporter [Nocardioides sp.]